MLTTKIDNLAVEVLRPEKIGHSYPLLLIHGAGGTSRYWKNYLQYFSDEGWEVYAINLRGHFPSDREEGLAQVTLEDYLDDVETVIHRLHLEQCAMIGHSLGGLIAQKTAEKNPSVSALVTLCSAPPMGIALEIQNDVPYAGAILKAMWGLMSMRPVKPTFMLAEKTLLNNIEPKERKKVFDMCVAESLVVGYQVAQGFPVSPEQIRCPKLVVGCAQDVIAPPYMQRGLAEFLAADHISYSQFAHLPMLENGWKTSAKDIAQWLQEKVQG